FWIGLLASIPQRDLPPSGPVPAVLLGGHCPADLAWRRSNPCLSHDHVIARKYRVPSAGDPSKGDANKTCAIKFLVAGPGGGRPAVAYGSLTESARLGHAPQEPSGADATANPTKSVRVRQPLASMALIHRPASRCHRRRPCHWGDRPIIFVERLEREKGEARRRAPLIIR